MQNAVYKESTKDGFVLRLSNTKNVQLPLTAEKVCKEGAFVCEASGIYNPITKTKRKDCEFKLRFTRDSDNGTYKFTSLFNPFHNHNGRTLENLLNAIRIKNLTPEMLSMIKMQNEENVSSLTIQAKLLSEYQVYLNAKDIANLSQGVIAKNLGNLSMLQTLVETLRQRPKEYVYEMDLRLDGTPKVLVFAYIPSLELFRKSMMFTVVDSTFGTNLLGMPLALFVSATPTWSNFIVAAGLITGESKECVDPLFRIFKKLLTPLGDSLKTIITD